MGRYGKEWLPTMRAKWSESVYILMKKRQLFSTKTFRSNPLVKGLSWIILESPNHWPLQHTNLIPIHSYPKFSGDNRISSMAAFLSQVLFKDTSQGRDVTPNGGSAMIQTPMHRGHHLTRNLFHLYRKWIMTMVVGHISEPCRGRNKAQDQMRKIYAPRVPAALRAWDVFTWQDAGEKRIHWKMGKRMPQVL
jgi:hypothetical protein